LFLAPKPEGSGEEKKKKMSLAERLSPSPSRLIAGLSLLLVTTTSGAARAATLPAGFTETRIATGLASPTAMAIAPDGRVFVCEQAGRLRVIRNGALLSTPFLTVTVNSAGERGLLGVAFDPDFASNRFVYVYYTATSPTIHNRVSRFTASATNPDVAAAGSEVQLLNLPTLSSATNHNGGALHFGPDGRLYIAVGENANGANAPSLNTPLGKMLRINKDGTIPTDNPFFNQTTGINRAIWARGLRNPFTFGFQPGTGRLHINDVGQNTWEEVNLGVAGSNYGWPATEGNEPPGMAGRPLWRGPLLWVGSAAHATHRRRPLPVALAHPRCAWRRATTAALDASGIPWRTAYVSTSQAGTLAPALAGLAVTVSMPGPLLPGLRVLGPEDGLPPLPEFGIVLLVGGAGAGPVAEALARHIEESFRLETALEGTTPRGLERQPAA
jgi:hypothetical protein